MGEVRHLPFETLSAFVDGELQAAEAAAAEAHVDVCVTCRAEARSLARLEGDLRLAPALSCDAADALISAAHDGEADDAEAAVAHRHLASCAVHRKTAVAWSSIDAAIVASLAAPSARVDRAVAALTAPKPAPSRPRPTGAVGVALRGAAVAALALAVALAGSLTAQAPATPVAIERQADVLVASVQQVVLHARTNTLYVAEPENGTVRALDASTYGLRAQIAVGGRPTALALNPVADRVVVLDAVAKRVSEIDPETNAVVGTTQITAAGTPTSLQVDSGGKVVVALVPDEGRAPRAALPTPTAGTLAVVDTSTKQLEIRSVDVAPRLVVPDPARQRTLLVSESATTIADASYRTIETIPGGVSAAFSRRSDRIAVASRGADGSRLVFHGEKAPSAVRIDGKAASVIALPDGGFAVLAERGGKGQIVVVDEAGAVVRTIELDALGTDLAYDEQSKRFTVVSAAGAVASASLEPAAVAAASPTPTAVRTATPTAPASPTATASSGPTSTPSAAPSASPTAAPTPSAVAAALPTETVVVGEFTRVSLAGRQPLLVASVERRIWFVDQWNQLNAIDLGSGRAYMVAALPRDAIVRALAVNATHVYALDISKGRLFQLDAGTAQLRHFTVPVSTVSAMTVAPGGTVWIAMPGTSLLVGFDPVSRRTQLVDGGVPSAVTLVADATGRLWYASGISGLGLYDPARGRVEQLTGPQSFVPVTLLAGRSGELWAGTATGEIYRLSGEAVQLMASVGSPISALAIDEGGHSWYLAPTRDARGFVLRPVSGSSPARAVSGPVASLAFGPDGRAWLADASGGFLVGEAR